MALKETLGNPDGDHDLETKALFSYSAGYQVVAKQGQCTAKLHKPLSLNQSDMLKPSPEP